MILPNLQMNAMVNVLNDKKLKIALVGCGGRGTGAAIQALNADENVQLVAMADAFEEMDRRSMVEVADVYDIDIPPTENDALLKKVRELMAEWDPKLNEQMLDILGVDEDELDRE